MRRLKFWGLEVYQSLCIYLYLYNVYESIGIYIPRYIDQAVAVYDVYFLNIQHYAANI
jgi:hypothetical protein